MYSQYPISSHNYMNIKYLYSVLILLKIAFPLSFCYSCNNKFLVKKCYFQIMILYCVHVFEKKNFGFKQKNVVHVYQNPPFMFIQFVLKFFQKENYWATDMMASGIQFYTCTGIPQTIQEECCDDQQSLQTGRVCKKVYVW